MKSAHHPQTSHLLASAGDVASEHDFAAALLADERPRRKGERTRAQLLAGGCRLLDTMPLPELTVSAICKTAKVAHGTFYLYFSDRHAFLAALLADFIAFVQATMRRAARQSSEGSERAATAAYYALFETNPGVMRCLVHHLDEFPEAREAFQHLNREWTATVARTAEGSRRRRSLPDLPRDELLRRAYALGGMVDQYLASLLISRDPALAAVSADRDAVIETMTTIWKKGMEA